MTAQLPCYVQEFIVVTVSEWGCKQNEISYDFKVDLHDLECLAWFM